MSHVRQSLTPRPGKPPPSLAGYLVEFTSTEELLVAARRVREAGYRRWDCHTPFPVHGLDEAMGIRPTRLPWIVLACGATGATLAFLMQWWMNAVDYPLIISGKPLASLPAMLPIIFELMVLLAAFGAFLSVLGLGGLPRFHHPIFQSERFRRATDDRFFISIDAEDPRCGEEETPTFLEELGGVQVERLVEEEGLA